MKTKENFKIYDVTNCEKQSIAIKLARYLKNQRQTDYEICSVNRI